MASVDSLATLLEEELKDIYDAEKQLTKALPKLAKKATSPELKSAIAEHLEQTEEQIARLEQVFDSLDLPAKGKKCKGMQNLIKEGEEMIAEAENADTRDAIIIAGSQKIEHYEISAYGTARTWANLLGHADAAELLEQTLDEEKQADQKLTSIAESFVNSAAADEEDDEEREEAQPARGSKGGRMSAAGRKAATSRGSRQQAADRLRGRR
jgi:ferritin-like metal-binding protein YciE